MTTLLVVAAGGAVGAVIRAALSCRNHTWPYGTLAVNLLGSFALGITLRTIDHPLALIAISSGLLGGLTTFSTFVVEGVTRPRLQGGAYVVISVAAGVGCAALGLAVGSRLTA